MTRTVKPSENFLPEIRMRCMTHRQSWLLSYGVW